MVDFIFLSLAIKVCENLLKVCTSSSSARSIVGSLQLASQALQIRDGVLHSTHAHFLQACVTGELYDVGNRFFVEHSVLEIDPNNSHLTPFAYMCYFYYGGLWYVCILIIATRNPLCFHGVFPSYLAPWR